MAHCGEAPKCHCECITQPGTQAINETPKHDHSQRVGCLKRKYQVSVINLSPSEIVLQSGFKDAQDLAVHVIFGDA